MLIICGVARERTKKEAPKGAALHSWGELAKGAERNLLLRKGGCG